jgi:hypothetical protein
MKQEGVDAAPFSAHIGSCVAEWNPNRQRAAKAHGARRALERSANIDDINAGG